MDKQEFIKELQGLSKESLIKGLESLCCRSDSRLNIFQICAENELDMLMEKRSEIRKRQTEFNSSNNSKDILKRIKEFEKQQKEYDRANKKVNKLMKKLYGV